MSLEQKIAFDKIRKILTEQCLSTLGTELVEKMAFSTNYEDIRRQVRLTMEFVKVLREDDFPDQNFFDVRKSLKRIRIQNMCLEVEELFDLQRSLSAICNIVSFIRRYEDDEDIIPIYPYLHNLTADVKTYPQIIQRVNQILDKYGKVKDTASPLLLAIRRELASTAGSISRTLTNIMRTAKSEGLVDKDISPTLRDGRLVIPVAPSMKRKIRGIVHDESDSGKTVFIEPAEVVEANNKIRELESDERKEIHRILMEFTSIIRPEVTDMLASYNFLAEIDFIRAKAKFAILTNSVEPSMENKQIIDWSLAVHPILDIKFQKHNESHPDEPQRKVIPLDLTLNRKQRILIISGPNAGGKSVCLKTTGLIQYMFQCGMPVPMAKSSIMGIFKKIYIDIGDEQSIENDLSTYSSHLLNMKNMMKHADGASLILIDEFGGGTEPQIGGAIAEAMLKRFNSKHTYGVITTHYQNLKHYAKDTDGIINGAMLYDRQQMQPLFQLSIGNPGSSFAIEIARKTGIPEEVINDASKIVGQDYINADKYLQDIVRDKRYWENKRQAIHQHEKQMEQTIARYEEEIAKLHSERKTIIAKAKAEAEELLKNSNARIEQTIREIKEAQAEKERTKRIRQDFGDFKLEIHSVNPDDIEEKIRRQMEKIQKRKDRKASGANNKQEPDLSSLQRRTSQQDKPRELVQGDFVKLKGQNTIGQITKINGQESQVAFGSIITNVKTSRLVLSEPPKKENKGITFVSKQTQDEIRDTTLNFKQEIDVRGMRGEEAVQAITYFIDDALVAGVGRVRILHGTGTGILRTLIRQYLGTMPAVSDFRDEHPQFGGTGVTIVELI